MTNFVLDPPLWTVTLTSGTAGVLAGTAGRRLLARLRRGAQVRAGPCELGVAVLWAVLGARMVTGHLPLWWALLPLLLSWFAVLLIATDLAHRRLPDALTLPAYPIAAVLIGAAAAGGHSGALAWRAAAGATALLAVHAVVHLLAPHALGAGDVKLAGSLGAVLGALGWAALVLGMLLGGLITAALGLSGRHRGGVPHGPGLLAATWLLAAFPGAAVIGTGVM